MSPLIRDKVRFTLIHTCIHPYITHNRMVIHSQAMLFTTSQISSAAFFFNLYCPVRKMPEEGWACETQAVQSSYQNAFTLICRATLFATFSRNPTLSILK